MTCKVYLDINQSNQNHTTYNNNKKKGKKQKCKICEPHVKGSQTQIQRLEPRKK